MISAEQLSRISCLLDEVQKLEPEARQQFLENLPEPDAPFLELLQEMLALAEAGDSKGFIDQIPMLSDYPDYSEDFQAGEMIGGYRLLRELGRGGMGLVWLAERADGLISRKVAIKLPMIHMPHKMLVQRFERERSILAALSHPHIARLYDAGISESGQPYLVMEYVEGLPITTYCDNNQLNLQQRLDLFAQVLQAVQYAHTNLIVHRDLKPANILVMENGEVRLLDFGIAKLLGADESQSKTSWTDASELTRVSGSPLTLDYASPEQFASEPVNTASDIYSLSVLLYEVLCGERPYHLQGLSRGQAEELVLNQTHLAPSANISKDCVQRFNTKLKVLAKQLKGDLDTVILKGLKRNPSERYATVDAFAQDLLRWKNHEPVRAQPDTRWYRTARFIGRNRLTVSLTTIAVLSLVVGLGVALFQTRSAQREAKAAAATETFLIDLFKANSVDQDDPVAAQHTTARVLLERGSQRVMDELNDSPETKLRVLKTLVTLNQEMGLANAEFLLQKQRLELFRKLHPERNLALAKELLDTFFAADDSAELGVASAPDYLQQAEALLNELHDTTSPQRGRLEIGKAFLIDGDNCTAAKHSKLGVELLRPTKPSDDLSDGLLMLAGNLAHCDHPEEAIKADEEAIDIMKATGHRAQLYYAYATIASAYRALGKDDLSVAFGRKSVEAAQKKLGPDDVPNNNMMTVAASLANKLMFAHPRQALDLLHPLVVKGLRYADQVDKDALVSILIFEAQSNRGLGYFADALTSIEKAKEIINSYDAEVGQRYLFYKAQAAVFIDRGMLDQAGQSLAQATELAEKMHYPGTQQINQLVIHKVNYQLRLGNAAKAEQELAAFIILENHPEQVQLGKLDFDLLKDEIALARRDWDDAITQAEAIHANVARYSTPIFARDIDAKAWEIEGRAKESIGQHQSAVDAMKKAALIQNDMRAGIPAI